MTITFVKSSFVDQIIARVARTVVRTPVTKTTDPITGAETLTTSSTNNISAVFLRRNKAWTFDKEGLIEGGDAYAIVKDTITLNKDDLLTVNGKKYRVNNIITRYTDDSNSTAVYKYANLFITE